MKLDAIASERERTLDFIRRIKSNLQPTKERQALSFLLNTLNEEALSLVTTAYVSNEIIELCDSSIDSIGDDVKLNDVKLGGTEFIFLETPIKIEGNLTTEVHFILAMADPDLGSMVFLAFQDSYGINGCLSIPFDTAVGDFDKGNYIADERGHSTLGKEKTSRNYAKIIKYYMAICSWRSSKIVVNDSVPVNRAFRKRAKGIDTNINIIRFRRKEFTSNPNESSRVYTHRWIVRGFFRRQWYPSLQMHKLIFVDSFIKGPKDAELKIREQVHLIVK